MVDTTTTARAHWAPAESTLGGQHSAWSRLHQQRLQVASKPFLARGHRLTRCQRCLLHPCFCLARKPRPSQVDYLLVFHRNEVLKPTNTGRLIGDCFPGNTWACTWHRTSMPSQVQQLLVDPQRQPILVFPGEYNPSYRADQQAIAPTNQRPLLIVIDGTWKQARKIYLQSPWLQTMPALSLTGCPASEYALRQAPGHHQLATVEAVAQGLHQLQFDSSARHLQAYFRAFNQHYLAMRSNCHNTGSAEPD